MIETVIELASEGVLLLVNSSVFGFESYSPLNLSRAELEELGKLVNDLAAEPSVSGEFTYKLRSALLSGARYSAVDGGHCTFKSMPYSDVVKVSDECDITSFAFDLQVSDGGNIRFNANVHDSGIEVVGERPQIVTILAILRSEDKEVVSFDSMSEWITHYMANSLSCETGS